MRDETSVQAGELRLEFEQDLRDVDKNKAQGQQQLEEIHEELAKDIEILGELNVGVACDRQGAESVEAQKQFYELRVKLRRGLVDRCEVLQQRYVDVQSRIREQLATIHLVEKPAEELTEEEIEMLRRDVEEQEDVI